MDKNPQLGQIAGNRYDVIVIGGGINGTAAARELAASGYEVLLAEREDLANGASSRSSRILHCGLRYFEAHHPLRTFAASPRKLAGAIGMAKAAMGARQELTRLYPDRCKPFTMCFPLYRGAAFRGWHLDLGFALLRRLGSAEPPLDYRRIKMGLAAEIPFARDLRQQKELLSIATYREYIMDWPDRICVDAAISAEQNGAHILLFTRATPIERTDAGHWKVLLTDKSGDSVSVFGKMVLNLAGCSIDRTNGSLPSRSIPRLVHGTKGAHIVVRLPERYRGFGIATLHRGGMPFYALPAGGDAYCFGPTETPCDSDSTEVAADDADIDFLLGEANFLLPRLRLSRRDVQFTWAGVRPLTFDPKDPAGRRTREVHDLQQYDAPGILAMTAGPVMSHRSAGREILRAVSKRLNPPGRDKSSVLGVSVSEPAADSEEALRRAVLAEHARDLKGILYTRTGLAWGKHLDHKTVADAARAVAGLLEWSDEERDRQIADFLLYQQKTFRSGIASFNSADRSLVA